MPIALSVADVIDKNKIASANAWLILIDIDIPGPNDSILRTLRYAKNNEGVQYQGNLYEASDFDINYKKDLNAEPEMKFSAFDITNAIRDAMEDYGGGIGFNVTFRVVNSGNLAANAEIEEQFQVIGASAPPGYMVEFTLGAENPLKSEFPYRRQYRDRCPWPYKGNRCGYAGSIDSCDYTLNGSNGCRAHDNIARFGAFPSLYNR